MPQPHPPLHTIQGSVMNKFVLAFGTLALAWPMAARAQAHVSMSLLSSRVKSPCDSGQSCSPTGRGVSLSVDAPLPSAYAFDLGGLRLDTVEIAYTSYGHGSVGGSVRKPVFVNRPTPATRLVRTEAKVSPSAIALNLLAHAPLIDDVSAHVRLGLAAVSTSVDRSEDGVSLGSVTENHLRPVIGLGASWAATSDWALTLDWDATRQASDGLAGPVYAWRLGVRWAP
jgi:hypothetical protein